MGTWPTSKNHSIRPKDRSTRCRWWVSSGSLPPELENGGSVGEFEVEKLIFNRPNRIWLESRQFSIRSVEKTRTQTVLTKKSSRYGQILLRSAWSLWDPPRSHQDPIRSRQIRWLLAKSSRFSHNPKATEDRSVPDENPTTRTNSIR